MRNPLNAGAQVNVTSPLFDENKNYLYSNLELTPNVLLKVAALLTLPCPCVVALNVQEVT